MLIEILGEVWLLSDIVCISLDEAEIGIKLRGWTDEMWELYDMDSEEEAKAKHIELVAAWKAWCAQ